MTRLDRLTTAVLSLLGLDLDFSIDLQGARFSSITETLYVGARPQRDEIGALREAGITHVVSCLEEGERASMAFLDAHFDVLFLPIRDGMDQDIACAFPDFFQFAHRARHSDPQGKLLVHCEVGVSRSPTLATALLMTSERMTFFEAFGAVRAKRGGVLPNIGFASQLQRLEQSLHLDGISDGELSSLAQYLHRVCAVPAELALVQQMLEQQNYDAPRALRAMFGDEIPRVVQGVRV